MTHQTQNVVNQNGLIQTDLFSFFSLCVWTVYLTEYQRLCVKNNSI